ncbi:MAG: hypothetical protein ABSD57_12025 [Verrucomicrobiota bacterium]|jgi:hypothetical protein
MHKTISLVAGSGEAENGFLWHRFNLPFQDKMLFLVALLKSQAEKTVCRFHALSLGGDVFSTLWGIHPICLDPNTLSTTEKKSGRDDGVHVRRHHSKIQVLRKPLSCVPPGRSPATCRMATYGE